MACPAHGTHWDAAIGVSRLFKFKLRQYAPATPAALTASITSLATDQGDVPFGLFSVISRKIVEQRGEDLPHDLTFHRNKTIGRKIDNPEIVER